MRAYTGVLRILRNFVFDIRYGGRFLGGVVPTRFNVHCAYNTVNTDYAVLDFIFRSLCPIFSDDVLVDVGCGRGRVINYWIHRRFCNSIIGVELDEIIANDTAIRLKLYGNVRIVAGSIIDVFPSDGTLFYLYNPFRASVLEAFKEKLVGNSLAGHVTRIVYYNPQHLEVFRDDKRFCIECSDISHLPGHSQVAVIHLVAELK